MLGISNRLSATLEEMFNHWSKVRITDGQVKQLIELAMCPNKETMHHLQTGVQEELSSCFVNMCESVYEYALTSPTQQEPTTKGTLFGAYNAVTGYFQNVRNYKDGQAKFKSIMGGTAQLKAQKAFDLCTGFAKDGAAALRLN